MKLVCPECSTEFDVPDGMLGARGKRVRCASCRHIWFQVPVQEDAPGNFKRMEESVAVEPIPASLHPDMNELTPPPTPKKPSVLHDINWRYLTLMVAGFVLGCLVLGGLLAGLALSGIASDFFISRNIIKPYIDPLKIIGVSVIESKRANEDLTMISGRLVNSSSEVQILPPLDFIPVDADGIAAEGLRIKSNKTTLNPQESMEFKAQLQGVAPPGGQIRVVIVR